MVNKFSADNKLEYVLAMSFLQWNSKHPSQLNHVVRQHKSPKTCTNKGPGTNFSEIFEDLFTRKNSQDKFSMTNETYMPVHKKCDISSTRANTACNTICYYAWGFGLFNFTGRHFNWSIYKITRINSTINPSVVCARLYINEFASDMS